MSIIIDVINALIDVAKAIIHVFRPIIEPILEVINLLSAVYTLVSFLEGMSLNANNTTSLIVFTLSFLLILLIKQEIPKWLKFLLRRIGLEV